MPGGVRGGQEDRRAGGRDREVDGAGDDVSDGYVALTHAGVAICGTLIWHYTEARLAYVKADAGEIGFSTPVDLWRQLAGIVPGTAITYTGSGVAGRCSR